MKTGQLHLPRAIIVYGSMIVVLTLLVLFIAACHPEEKKQRAPLQTTDTLQKDQQEKEASGSKEAFPGGDTIQQDCQFIQGQAESLLEEYHQSTTTKTRARQILVELNKLESEWKQKDCQQVFGYMAPHMPSPADAGNQVIK